MDRRRSVAPSPMNQRELFPHVSRVTSHASATWRDHDPATPAPYLRHPQEVRHLHWPRVAWLQLGCRADEIKIKVYLCVVRHVRAVAGAPHSRVVSGYECPHPPTYYYYTKPVSHASHKPQTLTRVIKCN